MPSSQPKRRVQPIHQQREVLEDLEPKPERKPSSSTKEVPVSKIVVDTLTDRISATASYAISTEMLKTVGRDIAISPVEAYNIVFPTTKIIAFYLPGTIIKTSLPPQVADNVEKIIITSLTYITRVASVYFERLFHRQLIKSGIKPEDKSSRNDTYTAPQAPQSAVGPIENDEEIYQEIGEINIPVKQEAANGQVPVGVHHFDFEELKAEGAIAGDMGLNY